MISNRLLLSSLVCFVVACASTHQDVSVLPTGFLQQTEQLRAGEEGEPLLVYRAPGLSLERYSKVHLESVSLFTSDDKPMLPKAAASHVTSLLYAAMYEELEKDWSMTETPDEGTIIVRVALTDASATPVLLDMATTFQAALRALTEINAAVRSCYLFVGAAAAELEVLDGATSERLYAAVDRRTGTKSLSPGFGSWSDVKAISNEWAKQLARQLRADRPRGSTSDSEPER